MEYDIQMVNDLIKNRRSIKPKQYISEPVNAEIIRLMLENARWAPTHGMTEPWRFFVFEGEGRKKLSEFLGALYKTITLEEQFNAAKYEKFTSTPLKASHIIYIGMKRHANGKITEVDEICAVASAVQNMQLTAEACGIGCYWSTGAMSGSNEMKAFLGLEPEDKCLGLLYIGNYSGAKPVATRTGIEDKTSWFK